MVRKLAIRGLRRGIGSMDYIHTLLIMEDDLDEDDMGEFGSEEPHELGSSDQNTTGQPAEPNHPLPASLPDWCVDIVGPCHRKLKTNVANKDGV